MEIRHEVVTPARAKQLITTYSERPGMDTVSVAFTDHLIRILQTSRRGRKDPRFQYRPHRPAPPPRPQR
jgi:hypothetical protein